MPLIKQPEEGLWACVERCIRSWLYMILYMTYDSASGNNIVLLSE